MIIGELCVDLVVYVYDGKSGHIIKYWTSESLKWMSLLWDAGAVARELLFPWV